MNFVKSAALKSLPITFFLLLFACAANAQSASVQNFRQLYDAVSVSTASDIQITRPSIIFTSNLPQALSRTLTFTGTSSSGLSTLHGNGLYGSFFIGNLSNVTFTNLHFTKMTTAGNGGALLVDASDVSFSSASAFSSNNAYRGGAIYAGDSLLVFDGTVNFSSNSASAGGGALYLYSSAATIGNGKFYCNSTSGSKGGAIYLEGLQYSPAKLTVTASDINGDGSDISAVFEGNTAAGVSNALHIGNYAEVNFNAAAGASIEMHDGISANATGSKFVYSGEGNFNLYAPAFLDGVDVLISASGGGAFNLMKGARLRAGNLANAAGSALNMQNSQDDTITVLSLKNAGSLNMDIFASNKTDKIISSGDAVLDAGSSLNLNMDFADTNFRKKAYKIIGFSGAQSGEFSAVTLTSSSVAVMPEIDYGDFFAGWITALFTGASASTNFRSLSGLTFNQSQTAKTFDALSSSSSGDLDKMITVIDSLETNDAKTALAQISGYFLANVIRSGAAESDGRNVFQKIKTDYDNTAVNSGVWAQYIGNSNAFFGDRNSPGDYQATSNGIMIGYDMIPYQDFAAGIYGKYASQSAKQPQGNSADIKNKGFGFYGGYAWQELEVKGVLSCSFDDYETWRNIPFADRQARASFGATALGAEFEGAYKYALADDFFFRPYACFSAKSSSYRGFNETGADSLNLKISGNSYTRTAAKIGAGLNQSNRFFGWQCGAEAAFLLSCAYPQITGNFENTDVSFESRGSEEGKFSFGLFAGVRAEIIENLDIFANANLQTALSYNNFYANIGARWSFYTPYYISAKEKKPKDNGQNKSDSNRYAPPPPEPEDEGAIINEDIQLSDDMKRALSGGIPSINTNQPPNKDLQRALKP